MISVPIPEEVERMMARVVDLERELKLLGETHQQADKLANDRGVELMELRGELKQAQELYGLVTSSLMEAFGLKCLPCQSVRFAHEAYEALKHELKCEQDASNVLLGAEWKRSIEAVNGDPEKAREHRIATLVAELAEANGNYKDLLDKLPALITDFMEFYDMACKFIPSYGSVGEDGINLKYKIDALLKEWATKLITKEHE